MCIDTKFSFVLFSAKIVHLFLSANRTYQVEISSTDKTELAEHEKAY